jgi:hypothetical protein
MSPSFGSLLQTGIPAHVLRADSEICNLPCMFIAAVDAPSPVGSPSMTIAAPRACGHEGRHGHTAFNPVLEGDLCSLHSGPVGVAPLRR